MAQQLNVKHPNDTYIIFITFVLISSALRTILNVIKNYIPSPVSFAPIRHYYNQQTYSFTSDNTIIDEFRLEAFINLIVFYMYISLRSPIKNMFIKTHERLVLVMDAIKQLI